MLEVSGLRKSYNGRLALSIDHFSMEAGEFVVLQGRNGSGKTTFLKLLAGLARPDNCDSLVFLGRRRGEWRCDRDISFLHQSPYLFDMSVLENVEYGLRQRSDPDGRRKAMEALHKVGMDRAAGCATTGLSGGEAQRVAFARIWALKPKLFLLDEPTAHLDRSGAAEVRNLLESIRKDGVGVMVSSHDGEIADIKDARNVRIDNGRIATGQGWRGVVG